MIIRTLEETDGEGLCALHRRAIRHNYKTLHPENVVEDWANSRTPEGYYRNHLKGEQFLVALMGGEPVGFIGWKDNELCGMYVDPDFQGQGIGQALVEAADIEAAERGLPEIRTVEASIGAYGFYEKLGFVRIGEAIFTVAGHVVPSVKMERPV